MASGGLQESGDDLVNIGTQTLKPKKLHQTVLNRCLLALKRELDVRIVMIYMQQKGLLDDVTIVDIKNERTKPKTILHIIDQIAQSDQNTYQQFKECLTLAKQEHLKKMLEDAEKNIAEEKKGKQEEKLHQTVLKRCLLVLKRDLDVQIVRICMQQKSLLDGLTIFDIENKRTQTKTILHIIDQIAKSDKNTYQEFKECLTLANQEHLKIMLEDAEKNVAEEMKEKQEDDQRSYLAANIRDKVLLEKHLNQLSKKLGVEYVKLGIELDVSLARIQLIQMENPDIVTQCFKILQKWVQGDKGQATFQNLEKACRRAGIDVGILNQIF